MEERKVPDQEEPRPTAKKLEGKEENPAGTENQEDEEVWFEGVCKWFNPTKGWGFLNIVTKEGEEDTEDTEMPSGDIFVHQSTIQKEGFRCLEAEEHVQFRAKRWIKETLVL